MTHFIVARLSKKDKDRRVPDPPEVLSEHCLDQDIATLQPAVAQCGHDLLS